MGRGGEGRGLIPCQFYSHFPGSDRSHRRPRGRDRAALAEGALSSLRLHTPSREGLVSGLGELARGGLIKFPFWSNKT